MEVFTEYTVTEADFGGGRVGATPEEVEAKSPYPTMVHFLKERFHCDGDYLKKLKSGLNMDALKAGDVVSAQCLALPGVEKLKVKGRIQPSRSLRSA